MENNTSIVIYLYSSFNAISITLAKYNSEMMLLITMDVSNPIIIKYVFSTMYVPIIDVINATDKDIKLNFNSVFSFISTFIYVFESICILPSKMHKGSSNDKYFRLISY